MRSCHAALAQTCDDMGHGQRQQRPADDLRNITRPDPGIAAFVGNAAPLPDVALTLTVRVNNSAKSWLGL